MTKRRYEISFLVRGSMRVSIDLDPEKSTGVGLASADQIEKALEAGQLSISSDDAGEVITTADGTIVGHTLHVRDETEWSDFTATRLRTEDE
jgi:hypothetical protein